MRNAIIGAIALIGAIGATHWNESRLARNDRMREIPDEIKKVLAQYQFPPTYAELQADLAAWAFFARLSISIESHRDDFEVELSKQVRMASNGL